jgi:uncharacterized integral membrane protein
MVIIGIVLIVLAVVLGLGVAVSSTSSTTLEVFGVNFGVMVPTVFFLGAAVGAALIIGLWFVRKGLGRGYRRRKEVRKLRQQVEAPELAQDPAAEDDKRLATEEHSVADGPESTSATHRRPSST